MVGGTKGWCPSCVMGEVDKATGTLGAQLATTLVYSMWNHGPGKFRAWHEASKSLEYGMSNSDAYGDVRVWREATSCCRPERSSNLNVEC